MTTRDDILALGQRIGQSIIGQEKMGQTDATINTLIVRV